MRVLPDEYDIVCQMQVVDREVFFYLAQRTDGKTGVVGVKCQVSYGGMALDLSERERAGRRNDLMVFSSTDVRHAVERLVDSGLLGRFSKAGKGNRLVLRREIFARFLARHHSDQKQVGRRLVDQLPNGTSESTKENNDIEKEKSAGWQANSHEVGRTNIHQYQHRGEQPFAMTLDWKPVEADLKMILFRAGGTAFSLDKLDPAWVSEFVSYWWGQSGRMHTERQWTAKLASQLIGYLRNPGMFEQQRGVRVQQEQAQQYLEKNSRALPGWAKPPRDDSALVGWMQANGFGDAPPGYDYQATRGWLRREIDKRMASGGMPKIVH